MLGKLLGLLPLLIVAYPGQAEVFVQATETLINGDAEVTAGRYSYYDLTLTEGEELVVEIQVVGGLDNSLTVWLLDLANFQRYKAGQQFTYFKGNSGKITSAFSYRFEVPEANIYYLILDNKRAAMAQRRVRTYAYKTIEGDTEASKLIKEDYSRVYDEALKRLFVFDDFDIYVAKCGTANAFSSPDILICYELIDLLFDQNVPAVMIFVFLHEVAHSLLNVWDYPLYDNEDAADELATALLLLFEDKTTPLTAAKWWAKNASSDEALSKMWRDDRHTVSPQRARNIVNWVNNEDELTRRWLHLLAPNMTDEALQKISGDNLNSVYAPVVREELLKRQAIGR